MKFTVILFAVCMAVVMGEPHVVQRGREILKEIQRPVQHGKEILKSLRKQSPGARIVGGGEATIEEAPWQVCLLDDARHFCGGSLISKKWVVTAAHCLDGIEPNEITVGAGNYRYNETTQIKGRKTIKHPQYNATGSGFPNDIGLIELESSFTFSEKIKEITMAEGDETFDSETCTITGWGRTNVGSIDSVSDTLQTVDMTVISNTACNESFSDIAGGDINAGHICVYESGKVISACSGDSGGPLVCVDGEQKLAGATSWGITTCSGDFPSVYTRISYFRDWIRETSGV